MFADASASPSSLKLGDWGFAAFTSPTTPLRGLCGTSYYLAPEVLTGGAYDARADVWSAGAVLYILLCGRPPFSGARDEDVFRAILESDGAPCMCVLSSLPLPLALPSLPPLCLPLPPRVAPPRVATGRLLFSPRLTHCVRCLETSSPKPAGPRRRGRRSARRRRTPCAR